MTAHRAVLLQDEVQSLSILYDSAQTEDFQITARWLERSVVVDLTPDEADQFVKDVAKAIKKLKKKQAKHHRKHP